MSKKKDLPVQEEMDMRLDYEKTIEANFQTAIHFIQSQLQIRNAHADPVHNRHEAYGIAAENLADVQSKVKRLKDDLGTLLDSLPDPNYPVLEAVSSIVNSAARLAQSGAYMAATMNIALRDLYDMERTAPEAGPEDVDPASIDDSAFADAAAQ